MCQKNWSTSVLIQVYSSCSLLKNLSLWTSLSWSEKLCSNTCRAAQNTWPDMFNIPNIFCHFLLQCLFLELHHLWFTCWPLPFQNLKNGLFILYLQTQIKWNWDNMEDAKKKSVGYYIYLYFFADSMSPISSMHFLISIIFVNMDGLHLRSATQLGQ